MALHKRDRFSFRWSKSELPDNDDINTQVLLLGITRFETTPSPTTSKKYSTSATSRHKTKCKEYELNASKRGPSIVSTDIGVYQSIEQLNKSTGCFPLERNKSKKATTNNNNNNQACQVTETTIVARDAIYASHQTQDIRLIDQKSHRNHFDRLFERFHSKRDRSPNRGVKQNRCGSAEQRAFYRWLHLNRNKRLERNNKYLDDVDQQRRTPVIRKCSTKSNSIRKSIKKSTKPTKSTSSRFSSCIPYCVDASRNDSIAGNSLASNQRFTEYYSRNWSGASTASDQHRHRLPASNDYLMQSHCKSNKRCSPSNKNTDNNHNNNCSLFNNLNIMDRSVDSIGSCSLDVDAESTDFSDTSGSLNVCTPSSGKDFTREFTSRIHERCQFPNYQLSGHKQQTKTILDPNSGKISTILSQTNPPTINSPTSPVKKPSYLNLACCVNGYSNLTTYDSKFRQSINKSREVSPIRPITYAVQYNRNGDNNYLSIPTAVPIHDNTINNCTMDAHAMLTPEKRYYSTQKTIELNGTNHDVTDNVNSNGCAKYFARSMLHTTNSATNGSGNTSLALVRDVNQEFEANAKGVSKSFIQQRVERLYGPAAVTQGLYSPKKPKSTDDNQETITTTTTSRTTISSVLVEKSQNTTFQSTKFVLEAQRNGHINGLANNRTAHDDENINLNSLNEALPVLRHLRPEFRAQLPTLSPKRTIAISKLNAPLPQTQTLTQTQMQTQAYTNGTSVNGKSNNSTCILNNVNKQATTNGSTVPPTVTGDLNQSTLDMQANKHQSSAFNATNDTTKNGCLTSNKSHDIEIDNRQKQIESPTNAIITTDTHLDTRNKPKIVPSNDKQDINTMQMSSEIEQTNCLIDASQNAVNNLHNNSNVVPIGGNGDGNGDTTMLTTNTTTTSIETMDANGNRKTDQNKDALQFLNAVQKERDRLIDLAIVAEKELDVLLEKGDVDEEILGHLRSAAGKARLLATKKFKQFEGLCNDSINQIARDMPPPTSADLQGFWEMVLLQVENVDSLYAELDKLRANGWKKPIQAKPTPKPTQAARPIKRPVTASKSSASSTAQTAAEAAKKSATAIAAAQKREAQRKQLAEMRRKNKMAMSAGAQATNDDVA